MRNYATWCLMLNGMHAYDLSIDSYSSNLCIILSQNSMNEITQIACHIYVLALQLFGEGLRTGNAQCISMGTKQAASH